MMKKYIKDCIKIGLPTILFYLGGTGIMNTLGLASPKINNQAELEARINEERENLSIKDKVIIHVNINNAVPIGTSRKLKDDEYEIVLGRWGENIAALRHELYHIADGHCDVKFQDPFTKAIEYYFFYEPQAALYATTGIKL